MRIYNTSKVSANNTHIKMNRMTIEETADYDYWEYELMVEELMSVLKEVDEK